MIKKLIQNILGKFGYKIIGKINSQDNLTSDDSMSGTLKRLKNIGVLPNLIIDMGAAKGSWTEKAMAVWPGSYYILIEPIREQISKIPISISDSDRVNIIEAVVGDGEGEVDFTITEDLDGSGVYGNNNNASTRIIKVVALDSLNSSIGADSVLLKLDTHGYELPIFNGAQEVLKNTVAIVVEVYGFYVSPTGVLFNKITKYLEDEGFRLFDIVDVKRRPADMAFWQADAIYIPDNSSIFDTNSYK